MSTSSVTAAPGAAGQVNSIDLQNFLQILSTQLTNQDPLKPLDDQAFLAQIAQFSTLEQSTVLNNSISQMLTLQSVTQSVGLIGKSVTVTANGSSGTGVVTALNYVNGNVELSVKGSDGKVVTGITLSEVSSVQLPTP